MKRFTRDKAVWVFDIQKKELRPQTPHDTGAIGYFNALEDKDGNRNFIIEEALSKIEGAMVGVMEKVDAREKLPEEDRHLLAHFVSLQMLRGPDFHDDMSKVNETLLKQFTEIIFADRKIGEPLWNKADKEAGGSGISYDEAREFISGSEYTIKTHRNRTLEMMLELAPEFTGVFLRQDWLFLCAPLNESFITCDRPFSIIPPPVPAGSLFRGAGIAVKGAKKLIPLSIHRCLAIGDAGNVCAYADGDANAVRQTNLNICYGANRFVIGCNRELVDSLTNEVQQACAERGRKWGGSKLTIG